MKWLMLSVAFLAIQPVYAGATLQPAGGKCSDFLAARKRGSDTIDWWAIGLASGYSTAFYGNANGPKQFQKDPLSVGEVPFLFWLEKHCRENPTIELNDAVMAFFNAVDP